MTAEEVRAAKQRISEKDAERMRRIDPKDIEGFKDHLGLYARYPGAWDSYVDSIVDEMERGSRDE